MGFILSFLPLLFIALTASAENENLRGSWQGEPYSISTSESFNYLKGTWGKQRYDLSVSQSFHYIRGSAGSGTVDLKFSKSFSYVQGQLPCGKIDYKYSDTFRYVRGVFCGQSFEINVARNEDPSQVAMEMVLEELLRDFPRPTVAPIRRFILSRIEI